MTHMYKILNHFIILIIILCARPAAALADSNQQDNLSDLLHSLKQDDSAINDSEEEASSAYDDYHLLHNAEITILNKITAKSETIIFTVGEERFFGNISIKLEKAIRKKNTPDLLELMLIKVVDHRIDDDARELFHGWMVPSRPSLSTLEHPVYEIIVRRCIDKDNTDKAEDKK